MSNLDKLIYNLSKNYCPSTFELEDKNRDGDDCIYGDSPGQARNRCIDCFKKALGEETDLYVLGFNNAIEEVKKRWGGQKNEV